MADELLKGEEQTSLQHTPNYDYPPELPPKLRIGAAVVLIVAALVSFFALAGIFASPQTYKPVIEALDAKRDTVMSLMGASTGSSAAISLLPGDAGSPIAEKLVDLSSDFLVVIAAIYLEKYLLTVLGTAAFKFLIPVGCVLVALSFLFEGRVSGIRTVKRLGIKLAVFGVAACLVVPASVYVSGMIENTYQASIDETIQTAEQTTDAIEDSAAQGENTDANNPLAFLMNVPEELNKLTEGAKNALNNFIEALAVMIVTSCVIPILVLVFFVWLAKLILGINIDLPPMRGPHHRR